MFVCFDIFLKIFSQSCWLFWSMLFLLHISVYFLPLLLLMIFSFTFLRFRRETWYDFSLFTFANTLFVTYNVNVSWRIFHVCLKIMCGSAAGWEVLCVFVSPFGLKYGSNPMFLCCFFFLDDTLLKMGFLLLKMVVYFSLHIC